MSTAPSCFVRDTCPPRCQGGHWFSVFVLLAQAEKSFTVKQYERDQLRKRHGFL